MKKEKLFNIFTLMMLFCIPLEPFIGEFYKVLRIGYIVYFLILYFFWRKNKKGINLYYILFIIFVIISFFSITYSFHRQSSISMSIELGFNTLLAIGISFGIRLQKDCELNELTINKYIYSFAIGTFIMTAYLLLFELPKMGRWGRLGEELFLNYGSFMVYSYCEIISICYILWDVFFSNGFKNDSIGKKHKYLKILILVVLIAGAIVSGTRKSILCPVLFIFFMLFLKYKKNFMKFLISLVIISLVILTGYKIIREDENLYNRIGIRIDTMIGQLSGVSEGTDGSLNERYLLKELSIELFKKHPIIGYGIHAFRFYSYTQGGPYLYAHCNYTELLADLGIIGFGVYYFAYVYLIYRCMKNIKQSALVSFAYAFLLMNLISDYSSVTYYRHYYLIIYFIFATFIGNLDLKMKLKSKLGDEHEEN